MADAVDQRIVFARDLGEHFDTRFVHARAATAGSELRVARGAYLPRDVWEASDARGRYLLRIRAVAETRRVPPVLSHWSAAAIHNLPVVGQWPAQVHLMVGKTSGGRSRNGVVKHNIRLDDRDVVVIDGMRVTSLARTIIDVTSLNHSLSAIAMVDRVLHFDVRSRTPALLRRAQLLHTWESMLPFRGHARSRDLIEFGETAAATPIESVSRFHMRLIGCPRPRLQTPFFDRQGFIGEPDFDWPDFAHIGESDGDLKYLDPDYRGGRTADQVVRDEKVREDRLRAVSRGFTRWRWAVALNPRALRDLLEDAGRPMGQRWV